MRKGKRILAVAFAALMLTSTLSGCGKKGSEEKPTDKTGTDTVTPAKEEPTVIRIGTNSRRTIDPYNKDSVTGEFTMEPTWRVGSLAAIEKIREDLNVDLKWVSYNGNVGEVLIKSVLANDPICEIADECNGTVIAQNVLQPLDEYASLFTDAEDAYLLPSKAYGHNFLFNKVIGIINSEVLTYNITYLEKIETLKENGKTVLPTDLWKQGKWTWSEFENYLGKVKTYYTGKKAPVRADQTIRAYDSDVRHVALAAISSNGSAVYGENGFGAASNEAKEAVAYVDKLYSQELLEDYGNNLNNFKNGEMVFAEVPGWGLKTASAGLGSRGEAMGVVPFPRPDDIPKDDPRYNQVGLFTGSIGVPKGFSKKITELAVKTFRMYYPLYFQGRSQTAATVENLSSHEYAVSEGSMFGIDTTNEVYGSDMADAYLACGPNGQSNELYTLVPWQWDWIKLVRNSIKGKDGVAKYDVAIDAEKASYQEQIDSIQEVVSSDKIVDNIKPKISLVEKEISIAKGTDSSTIDWSKYIKVTDNLDGDIDIKNATIDVSAVKFDTAGMYDKGLTVAAKDKEGNESKTQYAVMVFDPDNKTAPTIAAKESYRNIKLNEDTSKINWGNDFVDKAESAEGFNLKGHIVADVGELDVTKAGKYNVVLTVTDYAGNKSELKIEVTVA